MAPDQTKRKPRENAFPYEVGVKGRKTGITLPDTGIRDENGLEPMDHLFSSPQKGTASKSSIKMNGANATLSSDEMDEGESTIPEPTAVIAQRMSTTMRLPPPKSKSPIKTYLNSPARRNPSLGPVSSPVRGSIVEPKATSAATNVRRKLDFSSGSLDANEDSPPTSRSPQKKRGTSANPKPGNGKLTKNTQLAPLIRTFQFNGSDDEEDTSEMIQSEVGAEDSYQMVNGVEDEDITEDIPVEEPTEEPEVQPPQPTKKRGRPPKTTAATIEEPMLEDVEEAIDPTAKKNKAGRPKKVHAPVEEEGEPQELDEPPPKRARRSLDVSAAAKITANKLKKAIKEDAHGPVAAAKKSAKEDELEIAVVIPKLKKNAREYVPEDTAATSRSKKPTTETAGSATVTASKYKKAASVETSETTKPKRTASASLPPKPKAKNPIKNARLATIAESDSPQVQRGPPMPRRPGLMTVRRETPMEGTGFKQTRSGRNSIRPLAYWKNERAEYDEDEVVDVLGKFLVPTIKGVVRVDEVADNSKRVKRSKSNKPKKRVEESEDDEDAEPWEAEPGRMYGEVVVWDPEDPAGERSEEREEELALSSAAIITRDIAGASFRFAKTLTLPFFGSGIVDLPPGSIKKTKPSRKMQMAFFVFTGRVKVVINETEFRISKGGMFQVPRGNTYSIENDHDTLARIFFSQGCEVELEDAAESPRLEYPS